MMINLSEKGSSRKDLKKMFLLSGYIICLLAVTFPSFASVRHAHIRQDTSAVIDLRSFSKQQMSEYRHSPDFHYFNSEEEDQGLWSRIRIWVFRKIYDLITFGTDTNIGKTILAILIVGIIILAAYKITRTDNTQLFAKRNSNLNLLNLSKQEIQQTDFDQLIKDAVSVNNYRLAVRLWYLTTLKNLAAKGFIQWKSGKTNYEYVKELNDPAYSGIFARLTHVFEYCWYGEVAVSPSVYENIREQFLKFNRQIG